MTKRLPRGKRKIERRAKKKKGRERKRTYHTSKLQWEESRELRSLSCKL